MFTTVIKLFPGKLTWEARENILHLGAKQSLGDPLTIAYLC